ncbi:serum amyloid A isoform X2 [Enoplosus armatus]|uniref:serum amyloid A isoform X2 n=1 Tax=Enoplosus armatus TaxID=215367 RepID=UPI003995146F
MTMKLLLAGIVLILIVETNADSKWYMFPVEAGQGAYDMARSYFDMRKAKCTGADKYFHARGNYDAAQRGAGGHWASKFISDTREWLDMKRGGSPEDSAADQIANNWGREGGDPNVFRPEGLPDEY